jgi:hypothetical protein
MIAGGLDKSADEIVDATALLWSNWVKLPEGLRALSLKIHHEGKWRIECDFPQ